MSKPPSVEPLARAGLRARELGHGGEDPLPDRAALDVAGGEKLISAFRSRDRRVGAMSLH
jgi:hypothetical protein